MIHFSNNIIRRVRITDTWLILIILGIGAILRFWRLPDIPFTHDEFSAIIRAQFTSFHELIEKGVKIDGHPAGVQVFIYYMIKVFGVSEVALKTSFILFGLLSVWLVYLIGKKWFNSTVGLVSAAFISFLQYTVMYSQIARPYSSGLFFSLALVYFWTNVLFHHQKKYYLNLAGFTISAALCAYNHHFCMLFAVMVGITGLFFSSGNNRFKYLTACGAAIILYIPHLPVFFNQLSMGGVEGWLQKPRFDFLFDYLQYVFHFSVFVYLLIFLLISLSLYWYELTPPVNRKFILISAIWFLLPFLIGFFYSRYRSAVLQNSVLIFSFPYLLFLLFGYFKTVSIRSQFILILLIALIVIPSLIIERRHYTIFYKHPYREIVAESKKALDSLGFKNCKVILDIKKEINQYYLNKPEFMGLPVVYLEDTGGKKGLVNFLDSVQENYVVFGCLSSTAWETYAIIQEKFPWIVSHKMYNGGDFYMFSRNHPIRAINEYFSEITNTFETIPIEWGYVNPKQCNDSLLISGCKSFQGDTASEFGPTYSNGLRDMIHTHDDVIDVSIDLKTPQIFPGAWLVATITSRDKTVYWTSAAVNEFVQPGVEGRAFISIRISDIELRHHSLKFTTYLWNPMKLPYTMDNFRVRLRSGNPLIYALYRQLPTN